MRKFLGYLLLIVGIFLVLIQFFPTHKNQNNIPSEADLLQTRDVPSPTAAVLKNACYDCHSNYTNYPWYSKVQPLGWYLEGHIQDGKQKLNFSTFDRRSKEQQKELLEAIRQVVQANKMPLKSYRLLHSEGRLSKEERKHLVDWAESELRLY